MGARSYRRAIYPDFTKTNHRIPTYRLQPQESLKTLTSPIPNVELTRMQLPTIAQDASASGAAKGGGTLRSIGGYVRPPRRFHFLQQFSHKTSTSFRIPPFRDVDEIDGPASSQARRAQFRCKRNIARNSKGAGELGSR